jgi:nicotinic acid mononucleotide adenylyltransferase
MKRIVVLGGRFNPLTRAHKDLIDRLVIEAKILDMIPMIFVVAGRKSSLDLTRNPLSGVYRKNLIESITDVKVDVIDNIYQMFEVLDLQGYSIGAWVMGSDRVSSYRKLADTFDPEIKLISVDRSENLISGTMARNAVLANDLEAFKSLIPSECDYVKLFNHIREILDGNNRINTTSTKSS